MRNLVKAEWLKIWNGRVWWILSGFALLMCAMACAGFLAEAKKQLPRGQTTPEVVTTTLVNVWFMVELVAALVAMIAVTREFGNGAINRSVLLSGGRRRLQVAKLIAATAAGAVFAAATGVLAAASPWVFLIGTGYRPAWTAETTWTLLGVMAVVVAGAVWGSALGLLIRNQVAAVVTMLLSTWLVSESLFRLVPAVGKFTVDEAMAAVYHDVKPELLSPPVALAVLAGWLALAAFAGGRQFLHRDLP
ncbi:ABC transporter permease [Microbispora sp. RL4-1S]|uniref:ABC transporter permease n=1 Tax=Microbispora oryzae TaxID=2806554 RepID=A0A940WR01_9ACTN|nr:ABC transporter permease [Microbispora oryzae]MBP2708347.1 ABC transporter permease [Microbispora oryzae]